MPTSISGKTGAVVSYFGDETEVLLQASRESPRRRMIQQIQRDESASVQRLLNAMQLGTYIRPHCHPAEGASETVVLLQGKLGVVIFDDSGAVTESILLESGSLIDLEPGVWHSMVCLAEDTVIAEFKKGPYNAEEDKEFASWSIEEDKKLVRDLEKLFSVDTQH